jgi:3-hydroxyisobutyrate dehydrogenase-like beta-hydroxyacid dehydrogenase
MDELDGMGITVRPMGDEIGRASAIKMCYAAGTKGTTALHTALLTVAEALGVSQELATELQSSQPDVYGRMEAQVPGLPISAGRWIGEMEEIAATFTRVGVTPGFHQGAAAMFRLLSQTPFAAETPETRDSNRNLTETIAYLAQLLPAPDERRQAF